MPRTTRVVVPGVAHHVTQRSNNQQQKYWLSRRFVEYIGRASGGTMHWTSTSDRLFFHFEDCLHVAEFGKADPAMPMTAPATLPAGR